MNFVALCIAFKITTMKTLVFALRKIPVLLLVLGLAIMVSCKEKQEPKKQQNVFTPETSKSTTTEKSETTTSDTNGDVALNPAHGQPGHRCDIAVGAPLNSVPVQSTTNAQSGTPLKNSEGVALNPPHGQPGHRCDIKVGDPL